MSAERALRIIGYTLLLGFGLPVFADGSVHLDLQLGEWTVAYVVFGAALVGASASGSTRSRRLASLGLLPPAMLIMAALQPCRFSSLPLIIVASQAALLLAPIQTAALLGAQTLVLGYLLVHGGNAQNEVAHTIALMTLQAFAAVSVLLARREEHARAKLARSEAELRATLSLLEETSRVNERTRIARELHDVLGHDLTALGLQLEVARHMPPEQAGVYMAKAQEVSARLLSNVRDVVGAMREMPGPNLASALRTLVGGVAGLDVHLEMPSELHIEDGARAQCVLRCVQEIVTNALRHASAKNLWITIALEGSVITLDARDDGRGALEVRAGNGLSGMRARLEEMGGGLRVAAEPSRAFMVSACLPAALPVKAGA